MSGSEDDSSVEMDSPHEDDTDQGLGLEVDRFIKEKQKWLLDNMLKDEQWRKTIRAKMEAELDQRVREALETPPLERRQRLQMAAQSRNKRTLEDLERLNSHVQFDLPPGSGSDYSRQQKWKVLQAKRRMQQLMRSHDRATESHSAGEASTYRVDLLSSQDLSTENLEEPDSNSLGYDIQFSALSSGSSSKIKSQEYYAKISEKALASFASLTDSEKCDFYYAFTKNGFKEAMRTGRLPDGSVLEDLGNGKYRDRFGIIRDEHGPFWPRDYGPLYPAAVYSNAKCPSTELFSSYSEERSKRTVDNQQTPYPSKWRGLQVVFDSERSNRDYQPPNVSDGLCPSLKFESRFESGNLRQARRVGHFEYELVLRTDMYTRRHTQWFYFRVENTIPGITYKFKIINLLKKDSLYNHGMRPLMYSEKRAQINGTGWSRTGHHIMYSRNVLNLHCHLLSREMQYHMLEWQMEFPHAGDTCYIAHCYPFTYTDMKNHIDILLSDPDRAKVTKREVLCESLAGNSCFLLTVTNFENENVAKEGVVVTARVHPGETNSSWMMKGVLDFITGDSNAAKELRDKVVFKIVPMLNPDGVIVGNYRCSLAARDLNRNYRHPRRENFPTVFNTKAMMEELGKQKNILVYCDLHGHSRKQNVFMYGCNMGDNKVDIGASATENFLKERLFPWLMSQKSPDKFWFHGCKFQIRKCKESTGRVVMFRQLNILNSFTMEATFCGSTIAKEENRHFSMADFQEMGKVFCEVVLEYWNTRQNKETEQEAMVNVARVITHQILESRQLLPPDMPDFTTEAGKQKLQEIAEMSDSSSSTDRMTAAFVSMFIEQNNGSSYNDNKEETEPEIDILPPSGEVKKHNGLTKDVTKVLKEMKAPSMDKCLHWLEKLQIEDDMDESDSSDSDSESEPEMKWSQPKVKRKKKKKRKEKNSSQKYEVKKDKEKRPKSTSELPAIKSAESDSKKEAGSINKLVKNFSRLPTFVNKYANRSNGGIPCFSEERSMERAAKRMQEIIKKKEDIQRDHDAFYNYLMMEGADMLTVPPLDSPPRADTSVELREQFQQAFSHTDGSSQRDFVIPTHHPLTSDESDDEEEMAPHVMQQRHLLGSTANAYQNFSAKSQMSQPPIQPGVFRPANGISRTIVLPRSTGGMVVTSLGNSKGNDLWPQLPPRQTNHRPLRSLYSPMATDTSGMESLPSNNKPPTMLSKEYTDMLLRKLRHKRPSTVVDPEQQPDFLAEGKPAGRRHSTCE